MEQHEKPRTSYICNGCGQSVYQRRDGFWRHYSGTKVIPCWTGVTYVFYCWDPAKEVPIDV